MNNDTVPKPRPYRPVPKAVGLANSRPRPTAVPRHPLDAPPGKQKPKPKPPSKPPPAALLAKRQPEEIVDAPWRKDASEARAHVSKPESAEDAWSLLNPVEADSPVESDKEDPVEETKTKVQTGTSDEPASGSGLGSLWGLLDGPGDGDEDMDMDIDEEGEEPKGNESQHIDENIYTDKDDDDSWGPERSHSKERKAPGEADHVQSDSRGDEWSQSKRNKASRRDDAVGAYVDQGEDEVGSSDDDDSWGAWGKKSRDDKKNDVDENESSQAWEGSGRGHDEPGSGQADENAETFNIEGVASDSEVDSDDAWGDWTASGKVESVDKEAWGEWHNKANKAAEKKDESHHGNDKWRDKKEYHNKDQGGGKNSLSSDLPIRDKIDEVIPLLCGKERVVCVLGETGCGKSTQVPQILLEEAEKAGQTARIAVTQPRRVAALNLARRVAKEMGEWDTGQSVGYRIGGENIGGKKIDFCTVGYMLQLLMHRPQEFNKYTHFVLDEVHERSAESDMLCLVVKLLAKGNNHVRVIVMSATLQSDLFLEYYKPLCWDPPCKLHIKARCHPVEEFYLEDLKAKYGKWLRTAQAVDQRIKDHFPTEGDKKVKLDQRHAEKYHSIILNLLNCIAEKGTTILIFMPGVSEISALMEEGRALEDYNLEFFPLHSMIPREEQELVFQEPAQNKTHVVVATDIAESSITLPHVVAVIDLGLHRRVDHDDKKGMASLATKWISKAAAKQRSGRAGRTRPGIALRLYTRKFHDSIMADFEPPESGSMALDRLYLQAKQMSEQLARTLWDKAPASAEAVLQEMVQPPSLHNIAAARIVNAEIGTITAPTEQAKITNLGRVCLALPVDLRLARLVWFGAMWGIAPDAIVLASLLSSVDPFSCPSMLFVRNDDKFIDLLRASTSARLLFDGGHLSEPLMMRQLFLEWLVKFHSHTYVWGTKEKVTRARRKHTEHFSTMFSLARGRLEHVVSHVLDLSLRTLRCCDWKSRAYEQLKTFILGLGYTVNDRGDLAGIDWEDWKPFTYKAAFEQDVGYLKSLIAAAFSDNLLLGSYGGLPAIEASGGTARKEQLAQQAAVLKVMREKKLKARQTAVFMELKDALTDDCLEFVLGGRKDSITEKISGASTVLVDMGTPDAARWHALDSRPSGHLLDSPKMLVAEFSLLSHFEKNVRDLVNAKIPTRWSGHLPSIQHPCMLRWELMQQVINNRGTQVRCEAILERRNALGCVGYVQDLKPGTEMKRVAVFGVAGTLRGGENPSRTYPTGVTSLEPGHIGFILATAKVDTALWGLQRFGFTLQGALAILHRSVELPRGVIDRSQWQLVLDLRKALRDELKVPEEWWSDSKNQQQPVVFDGSVEGKARALWKSVAHLTSKQSHVVTEDKNDPTPKELVGKVVNLFEYHTEKAIDGPVAFWPLVPWGDLEKRRDVIIQAQKNPQQAHAERMAKFKEQKEQLAAQMRASGTLPTAQTSPANKAWIDAVTKGVQPASIPTGATSMPTGTTDLTGRWIEIIGQAGSLKKGDKQRVQSQFLVGKFGITWLRLADGNHIGANLEGKVWRFCDPPPGTAPENKPTTVIPPQTQTPSQPRAQTAATPTPNQPQPQPQTQTQTPPGAWNTKTAAMSFDPSAPVTSLSALNLFLQIISLKTVIWSFPEKEHVASLMDGAIRRPGFFSNAADVQTATNCITQVRLVNPTVNLGGMPWPPGWPMPMGVTATHVQFRRRFCDLLGELLRRAPTAPAWPGTPAASQASPAPGFVPPTTTSQAFPHRPGFAPVPGFVHTPGGYVSAPPGFHPTAGTSPPPGFMPPTGGTSHVPGFTPPTAGAPPAQGFSPQPQGPPKDAASNAAAFLPPREELLKLSASQLKEMIKQVGLSTAGCFEKSDLVDRLYSGPGDAVAKVAADVRGSSYTPGNSGTAPTNSPVDMSSCAPKTPTEDAPRTPPDTSAQKRQSSPEATGSQTAGSNSVDESQLSEGAKAAAALLLRRRAKKARTAPPQADSSAPPVAESTAP